MIPIVVSGAQGLLGKSTLSSLIKKFPGTQVIALARSIIEIEGVETVLWNLPEKIPSSHELPSQFHYIHTANLLKSEDPSLFYQINCVALEKFLNQFDGQIASVIWPSSLSVLGQGPFTNAKENDSVNPQTPLAESRLLQEKMIMEFCQKKNISCFGLRGRLYIGPEEKEFNSYLRLILKKPFLAFNQAKTKISVISSEDFADIACELLKEANGQREIFNIAYKKPLEMEDFLKSQKRLPSWTLSTHFLKLIILFLPVKIRFGLQTKIELLGQDQVMDVTKLESFIGYKILGKNPVDIVNQYIKSK